MDRPDLQQIGLQVPVETPRAGHADRAIDPAGQADAGRWTQERQQPPVRGDQDEGRQLRVVGCDRPDNSRTGELR